MDRTLAAHASLALVAAGLALMTWAWPEARGDEAAVWIWSAPAETRLTQVDWQEDGVSVQLLRPGAADPIEVRIARPGQPPQRSIGGAAAAELMARLTPLRAARDLGHPSDLAAFGLQSPGAQLKLQAGDARFELAIGGSTYGVEDLYARTDAGQVLLLRGGLLAPLRHGASTLPDRSAIGLGADAFDHLLVDIEGRRRSWAHRQGADAESDFLSDAAEPDRKLQRASAWLRQLLALRGVGPAPSALPSAAPALVVTFKAQGRVVGTFRLWDDADANSLGPIAQDVRLQQPMRLLREAATHLRRGLSEVFEENPSALD